MAARARSRSPLVRPLVVLALPGMYLLYKYNQYRQQQMESARRRVTERELLHLNTKIAEVSAVVSDKPVEECSECCAPEFKCGSARAGEMALCEPKQRARDTAGVHVAILGAQWPAGRYLSLLLKQDTFLNKLTLFDSRTSEEVEATKSGVMRDLSAPCSCADLRLVDTRCRLEAYCASSGADQLDRSLQNSSVVVMVGDAAGAETRRARERRLTLVRGYAEAVRRQCPEAVLIVDVSPVDCCVPVVVQTLLEAGGRADSARRVLGAVAVAEARASSVAARALGLDVGVYSRVPIVGGADPHTVVPLFSNALDGFTFDELFCAICEADVSDWLVQSIFRSSAQRRRRRRHARNPLNTGQLALRCEDCIRGCGRDEAMRLTREVRCACASGGGDVQATRAYALARLVSNTARAQVCGEAPCVSAYLYNDCPHTIHSARYLSRSVRLRRGGTATGEVHPRMSPLERHLLAVSLHQLARRVRVAQTWCARAAAAACAAPTAQLADTTRSPLSHCGRARASIGV